MGGGGEIENSVPIGDEQAHKLERGLEMAVEASRLKEDHGEAWPVPCRSSLASCRCAQHASPLSAAHRGLASGLWRVVRGSRRQRGTSVVAVRGLACRAVWLQVQE
eukprot:scaffold7562_cov766-Prasinococcus_capsulatus_cf.AAC.1